MYALRHSCSKYNVIAAFYWMQSSLLIYSALGAFLLDCNRLPMNFRISSTSRIGADHISTVFQSSFVSGICREKEEKNCCQFVVMMESILEFASRPYPSFNYHTYHSKGLSEPWESKRGAIQNREVQEKWTSYSKQEPSIAPWTYSKEGIVHRDGREGF